MESAGTDSRARLIRAGLEILTEQGFGGTSLDDLLRRAKTPKGSFYHHFPSKHEYALVLIGEYNAYFRGRLLRAFSDKAIPAADRILRLVADVSASMARHGFRRGCLIGNFGQEFGAGDAHIQRRVRAVFEEWEALLSACLREGQADGSIRADLDPAAAARLFWIGWEGAVMRARIMASDVPLQEFAAFFLSAARPAAPDAPTGRER